MQHNEGTVTLRRVQVRPRPGSARITSSWRDGLHVKGNRAALLFEDCVLEGMNELPAPAAMTGMPALVDLLFEENEIDGHFDLRHAQKVQLVNNRFAPERGQLTISDCREVLLQGNRLGAESLPAARIQIEDQATRDSVQQQ